jgi:ABC-type multidrug transport system ATPase subunit/pSer/pThr/pTyr-binding forkhead associated (FHA) protein
MSQKTIGRSPDCDVVFNHAHISSVHATLVEDESGRLFVRDMNSTNGVYLNSLTNRITESEITDDDILYFSKRFSIPVSRLRGLGVNGTTGGTTGGQSLVSGAAVIRIGRDPRNDLVINRLGVSKFHAEILRNPDGSRLLRDLGSTNGSYLNNQKIQGTTVPLGPEDRLEIGGMLVSIQFSGNQEKPDAQVGVEREGLYIQATDLVLEVKSGGQPKRLIDGVDLVIYPGELVGLMGPSGCGKTTLMNLLIGNTRPTSGLVRFNGAPLQQNLERFSARIGFVPQDDLLHPELTVREVLYYNARLKLPLEVSDEDIYEKIDRVCQQLNLYRPGTNLDARDVLIGSPEKKGISGGQKKRVSLAIELLSDPEVLFLDEPTSGLSSKDTKDVMVLLRKLTKEQGIAVVITIHQPSLKVYELMDRVIYLKQGKLCYFGPAFPDSISYFEPEENPYVAGPEAVMEKLDDRPETELRDQFMGSDYFKTYVHDRAKRMEAPEAPSALVLSDKLKGSPVWVQGWKLCERYLKCKMRDWPSVLLLLAQAPVVGVLISVIFWDDKVEDRLTTVFLLGFVALWFGVNNSAREIVGEISLLRRERRGGLSAAAYLASKLCVLGLIAVLQSVALVGLVAVLMPGLELQWAPAMLICGLVACCGVSLGLMISAFSKTSITAIVAIPLVLIPVILLGGLIKLYHELSGGWLLRLASDLTPARWSFEALTTVSASPKFVFGVSSLTESWAVPVLALMLGTFSLATYLRIRSL